MKKNKSVGKTNAFFINNGMGCNCNKEDSIPLSVKKEKRRSLKEKINEVKRIWRESATSTTSGNVTVSKDELGFK